VNEEVIARKIVGLLNTELDHLSQDQVARLASVRDHALARVEASSEVALATVTNGTTRLLFGPFNNMRMLAPGFMLLVVLAVLGGWYALSNNNDARFDDAELLEDELPLHAYLDHDFDSWLNRSSR
jgi:Protein of unknown function (DUF3619)